MTIKMVSEVGAIFCRRFLSYITVAKQPCYGPFVYYGTLQTAMHAILAIIADSGQASIVIYREAVEIYYFLIYFIILFYTLR